MEYKYGKFQNVNQETRWATMDEIKRSATYVNLSDDKYPTAGVHILSDGHTAYVDGADTHTLILIDGYRDSNYDEIIGELCPELENTVPGEPLHSKRLPFLRNVITIGFKKKGCLTWEEAIKRAPSVPKEEVYRLAATVDVNDVCNMQYTSGTTGFPKGVMLTHYNVVNNGKAIGDCMDLSTADRMMIQVPMFHCFGMVLSMTSMMTHGGTLCPIPYFSPKSSLACVNDEKITCFNGRYQPVRRSICAIFGTIDILALKVEKFSLLIWVNRHLLSNLTVFRSIEIS